MVDAYPMANGEVPITGYSNNGLTPIINSASGYEEEGYTTAEGDTAGSQAYGKCTIGSHATCRLISQGKDGLELPVIAYRKMDDVPDRTTAKPDI